MTVDELFDRLWRQYCGTTATAARIHQRFMVMDGQVVNDHVAFRTFADSPISLARLEPALLSLGYRQDQHYAFAEKKLRAVSYLPAHSHQPRIFLSELVWQEFSSAFKREIAAVIAQIPPDLKVTPALLYSGRLWSLPRQASYELLAQESEYAAWLYVWGMRANHFTVSVNHLTLNQSLEKVVHGLQADGFALNTAGGAIKGSPQVGLVQASTLADQVIQSFVEGELRVPACYYEFAQRYPDANGTLYEGFVVASADRIFESTHRQESAN